MSGPVSTTSAKKAKVPTAFMLRYTLSHPHVHTIIAGTLNPDHLAENVATAQRGPLPPDTYARSQTTASTRPANRLPR